jgi:hypothetical protein
MKSMMVASAGTPVSPYGPTMPQPAYQPKPDEPVSFAERAPSIAEAPSGRLFVPVILIALGILALVVVLLVWLLG